MSNWCATNWKIVGSEKSVRKVADIFNSLFKKENQLENGFGETWLGSLYALIYGKTRDQVLKTSENVRGLIDPNPCACACLFINHPDPDDRFVVEKTEDGLLSLSFTTQSAYDVPYWMCNWFASFEEEDENFAYGYKATDEFGNFHVCRNGGLIGGVYVVDHEDGNEFGYGEKEAFLDCIEKITGLTFDRQRFIGGDYQEVLRKIDEYNEDHEDEECYVAIFKEIDW